jgi:hypothetical protein
MTFLERYLREDTWFGKVMVMEIFHLAMTQRESNWTITKTAREFGCSIGLVSENLRLANEIHNNDKILKCGTRQEALRKIPSRKLG